MRPLATIAALLLAATAAAAGPVPPPLAPTAGGAIPEPVVIPPLAASGAAGVALVGHWFRAVPTGEADVATTALGAVLLLHGCGGAYRAPARTAPDDAPRRLDVRFAEVVDLARSAGWHALVIDSFGPRGERELCTQRLGTRRVTQRERRLDALAALAWLARQPGVDAARLGLIGWSHGGSTVLAAVDGAHRTVASAPVAPAFAVAHYPGCGEAAAGPWRPVAPLLLLLGEDDDWTPAAPCQSLAAAGTGTTPAVTVVTYPRAVHGFDGATPVRRRTDMPNGGVPGEGVSVGRQDTAARDARDRLAAWLRSPAPGR